MFEEPKTWDVEHISLAKKADVFLIAPATANVIGKIANGICDDMLTTTVMATTGKVLIAPAMNTNMYKNPILQRNISILKELGYNFVNPESEKINYTYQEYYNINNSYTELMKNIDDYFKDGKLTQEEYEDIVCKYPNFFDCFNDINSLFNILIISSSFDILIELFSFS